VSLFFLLPFPTNCARRESSSATWPDVADLPDWYPGGQMGIGFGNVQVMLE
jgi:hypothetical protein